MQIPCNGVRPGYKNAGAVITAGAIKTDKRVKTSETACHPGAGIYVYPKSPSLPLVPINIGMKSVAFPAAKAISSPNLNHIPSFAVCLRKMYSFAFDVSRAALARLTLNISSTPPYTFLQHHVPFRRSLIAYSTQTVRCSSHNCRNSTLILILGTWVLQ